ncbi:MAG: protein kinase, partial [Acidobacteriales bacterium]|nr:protein kinase [Terriglobales bacterium]
VDVSDASSAGIAGTIAYMAPEQASGKKQLTTAIDIHALGVILFELLTGGVPYGGADVASILRRLTDETEPVPSVSRFRPDVPADLEAICMRCLSRMPLDRYLSAQALADAIDRFIIDEPQIDAPKRGWATTLARAFGWRREMPSMGSWWAPFWGAASTFAALAIIQLAILLDAPSWVSQVVLVYYLSAWAMIAWLLQSTDRGILNPVERSSAAIQYGMMLACASLVPTQLWFTGGSIAAVFQPFAAIIGLGIFVHGVTYWGRLYVAGLLLMGLAAFMPLFPVRFWPGAYGIALTLFQVLVAFHLRRVHREAETARAPQNS